MSIQAPARDWFKAPTGNEKIWIGLAVTWCLVMSLMMPYWHFAGKQNSAGEAYSTTPAEFEQRVEKFVKAATVDDSGFYPIVEPPPGGHAYLFARQFFWYPILQLRAGETYKLHLSSGDVQHGFSLQPMNMNFQVLPGYDHVLTLKPTAPGTYPIVCNEFCGVGHQQMVGKIIVK
ncbi:MAG: cytochrome C oxidase subunit II [Verrucomicrobia bacterium]|nr:cytochrome C oxidase subunit II [Verrucomicrobiota bacterium]